MCFSFHVISISYVPIMSGVNVTSYSPSLQDFAGITEFLIFARSGPVICTFGFPCIETPFAEIKNLVKFSTSAFDKPGPHALAIPESTTLNVSGESKLKKIFYYN